MELFNADLFTWNEPGTGFCLSSRVNKACHSFNKLRALRRMMPDLCSARAATDTLLRVTPVR
jgi:hypothetical protein